MDKDKDKRRPLVVEKMLKKAIAMIKPLAAHYVFGPRCADPGCQMCRPWSKN